MSYGGINPLCALLLYEVGVNVDSVLFYRYVLAAVILGLMMMAKGISFGVNKTELASLAVLGVLFAISSLSLFSSFHYMDAGIASTILFVYPVMVAVIMAVFFKEKVSLLVVFSILLAFTGIALLCQGDGGHALSMIGILLVMLSSLTYAVYIVTVNRSVLKTMSPIKLTFYVLLFCALTIIVHSDFGSGLQMLTTPYMWGNRDRSGYHSDSNIPGDDGSVRSLYRFYPDSYIRRFGAGDSCYDRGYRIRGSTPPVDCRYVSGDCCGHPDCCR